MRGRLPEEYGIKVAGKTGTAQTRSLRLDAKGKSDIAWFVGFAPVEKPEIVVVAAVENGGHGGVTSAPIVREVMQAYFRDRLPEPEEEPAKEEVA